MFPTLRIDHFSSARMLVRGCCAASKSATAFCIITGFLLATGGCQSNRPDSMSLHTYAASEADAVLALAGGADEIAGDMYPWELSRCDSELGTEGPATVTITDFAEIRHREFLRTTNGRPRNDSYTTSRSLQQRIRP